MTASTLNKIHHFRGANRLGVLHRGLLSVARDFGWQLEAWAVFSNHYHFVAHSPPGDRNADSLPAMLKTLHVKTGGWVNKLDRAPGRHVWFNFRETRLSYQRSYLARLNYTHQNPVKHGLVPVANQYPWCSAPWFERTASPAQVASIYRFKTERVLVPDEYAPAPEWWLRSREKLYRTPALQDARATTQAALAIPPGFEVRVSSRALAQAVNDAEIRFPPPVYTPAR